MQPPRLRWVIFAAVVAFLVAALMTSFFRELTTIDRLSGTLDRRMEELVREKRKTQDLKQKLEYYGTPEGMARLAREKFNLVQSGEKMYKIEVTSTDSPK